MYEALIVIFNYFVQSLCNTSFYLTFEFSASMFSSRFINRKKHLLSDSLSVFQTLISASDVLMFNIKKFDDDNDDENATFVNNFVKALIIA